VPGRTGAVSVMVDTRTTWLTRAANPARLLELRSIIETLDRPRPVHRNGNIWVVY
jgi:hypothetical protein